jgi:hypothetical protein
LQEELCLFMNSILNGKPQAAPTPALAVFLMPTCVEPTDAVTLLSCDAVRLLMLCRVVAPSFKDLEFCARLIAAAFALQHRVATKAVTAVRSSPFECRC